jgi:methyltransferase-like protein
MQNTYGNETNNINNMIQQYQQQKNACELEIRKLQTDLAIGESNLKQLLEKAQETFGTTDPNMLNTILSNLTAEVDSLTTQLNQQ